MENVAKDLLSKSLPKLYLGIILAIFAELRILAVEKRLSDAASVYFVEVQAWHWNSELSAS